MVKSLQDNVQARLKERAKELMKGGVLDPAVNNGDPLGAALNYDIRNQINPRTGKTYGEGSLSAESGGLALAGGSWKTVALVAISNLASLFLFSKLQNIGGGKAQESLNKILQPMGWTSEDFRITTLEGLYTKPMYSADGQIVMPVDENGEPITYDYLKTQYAEMGIELTQATGRLQQVEAERRSNFQLLGLIPPDFQPAPGEQPLETAKRYQKMIATQQEEAYAAKQAPQQMAHQQNLNNQALFDFIQKENSGAGNGWTDPYTYINLHPDVISRFNQYGGAETARVAQNQLRVPMGVHERNLGSSPNLYGQSVDKKTKAAQDLFNPTLPYMNMNAQPPATPSAAPEVNLQSVAPPKKKKKYDPITGKELPF